MCGTVCKAMREPAVFLEVFEGVAVFGNSFLVQVHNPYNPVFFLRLAIIVSVALSIVPEFYGAEI